MKDNGLNALKNKTVDFNGWHFVFERDVTNIYKILAKGSKNEKRIFVPLKLEEPTFPVFDLSRYIEKEETRVILSFERNILPFLQKEGKL